MTQDSMDVATGAGAEPAVARPGESVFSWSIFPAVMCGSVGLSIYLLESNTDSVLAMRVPIVLGYAAVIVAERLYPHVPAWNRSHGDVPTDAAWWVSLRAVSAALGPVYPFVAIPLGAWLSQSFGSELWPSAWPLAGQLVLALVIVEFFHYWAHRWMHEIDFLWRFHATHHSAPRLYWLNFARFHPVDIALLGFGFSIPLIALGADWRVFALWALFSGVHGLFQHSNIKIRCGPLNWVFSMAELHRWHHSRTVREANTNYGNNLILWDIVFRTRFLPKDRVAPADIGIANLPAFPMTWWKQLISPLQWSAIKRASEAGGS